MKVRIEIDSVGEGVPDSVLRAAAEHAGTEIGRLFAGRVVVTVH